MTTSIKKKIVTITSKDVSLTLRKVKKAKGIRILISSGEKVTVTGSNYTSFGSLERFFMEHKKWVEKKLEHFQQYPNFTHKLTPQEYKQKKEAARVLVLQKLKTWNQVYQFSWSRVTIRNQSTRWGSCSSKKTLSFHAAIVDLPTSLQDYLIVHELCHLGAMNHGEKFWNLIQQALPNGRVLDAELKKHSPSRVV